MVKLNGINGCEMGRQNRLMIDIMEKKLDEIIQQNKELYNHQSKRWPPLAVGALSILSALLGALLTRMLSVII